MVMHLPQPAIDNLTFVEDVVAERKGGVNADFFTNVKDEWRDRTQMYIDHCGSPQFIQLWPAIENKKNSFLNLYSNPIEGSVQGKMLESMRKHKLNLCPACGEAGRPNTLDHYLPKGRFPHFCIMPLNLFPMCDACQSKKLEKTGDQTTPRYFLHPYFDNFVAQQAVVIAIEPPFEAPTFTLTPSAYLTVEQTALVKSHIKELKIEERYAHFFREQHRRLIRLCGRMRDSQQNIPAVLVSFRDSCANPCSNSWEHVFYDAVISNPDLINYLENQNLPLYP